MDYIIIFWISSSSFLVYNPPSPEPLLFFSFFIFLLFLLFLLFQLFFSFFFYSSYSSSSSFSFLFFSIPALPSSAFFSFFFLPAFPRYPIPPLLFFFKILRSNFAHPLLNRWNSNWRKNFMPRTQKSEPFFEKEAIFFNCLRHKK